MGKGRAGGGMGGAGGMTQSERDRAEIAREVRRNRAIDLRSMLSANRPLGATLEGQASEMARSTRSTESVDRALRVSRDLLLRTQRDVASGMTIPAGDMLQLRIQVARDNRALYLRGRDAVDAVNRTGWHTATDGQIGAIGHYFAGSRGITQMRGQIATLTRRAAEARTSGESATATQGRRNAIAALQRGYNLRMEARQFGRDFTRAGG